MGKELAEREKERRRKARVQALREKLEQARRDGDWHRVFALCDKLERLGVDVESERREAQRRTLDAQRALRKAKLAWQEGNPEAAKALMDEVKKHSPWLWRKNEDFASAVEHRAKCYSYHRLAQEAEKRGNINEALKWYRKLLRLSEDAPWRDSVKSVVVQLESLIAKRRRRLVFISIIVVAVASVASVAAWYWWHRAQQKRELIACWRRLREVVAERKWAEARRVAAEILKLHGDNSAARQIANFRWGKYLTEQKVLRGHKSDVESVSWSPDGRYLASGGGGGYLVIREGPRLVPVGYGEVRVWDAKENFKCIARLREHTRCVTSVSWSPDGRYLASASWDATVRIWDVKQGFKCIATLRLARGASTCVWSPDGRYLAVNVSPDDAKAAAVFAVQQNFKCVARLSGHSHWVRSVSWSPDGRYLTSASLDKTVRIWNAKQNFKYVATLYGHTDWVLLVSWSPDGRHMASAPGGCTLRASECKWAPVGCEVRIWDAKQDFRCVAKLRGHALWVFSVSWSPDGRYLASGSWDKTVRIWDAKQNFKCSARLRAHTDYVWSVAWSPDGRYLASGSYDKTVRIWGVSQEKVQQLLNAIDAEIKKLTK